MSYRGWKVAIFYSEYGHVAYQIKKMKRKTICDQIFCPYISH